MPSSTSKEVPQPGWLLGGYSGGLLVSVWSLFVVGITGRLLIGPLLPTIISEFAISLTAAGFVVTILEGTRALALYPSGHFSDQLSRSTLIVPGGIGIVVGLVAIAVAPVYIALLTGAALLGLGLGGFGIAARALVADHFVQRRGRALGFFAVGFNVSGVAAPLLASIIAESWRLAFLGLAALITVLTVVFVYWNRESYVIEVPSTDITRELQRVFTTPTLQPPLIVFSLFLIVTTSVIGFFPTYLQQSKGLSADMANLGFALIFVIGFTKFGAGALSDRISRWAISSVGLLVAAIGLSGVVIVSDTYLLWLSIIVFALGHQAQFPLMDAIITDAASDTTIGSNLGVARTLFSLVGSLGPTYVGVVSQFYNYSVAFWGLVGCLLIGAVVMARQVTTSSAVRG